MTSIEILIFTMATLGVGLGIVNLWYSRQSHRVRLRVIPKVAFDVEAIRYTVSIWNKNAGRLHEAGNAKRWMIEVINLSSFGVTIDEVGFGDRTAAGNFAMVDPEISRKKKWPVRLRPHEKAIFYSTDGMLLPPAVWSNPHAYAKTDCEECVYGTSPVLDYVSKNKDLLS